LGSLILLLATAATSYFLDAVFVGALLYALRSRFSLRLSKVIAPMVLLATFAVLDLYFVPAVAAVDIRVRILNQTVAEWLGLSGEISVIELSDIGWFDLLVWAMQVLVAARVAETLDVQSFSTPANSSGGGNNPA
jgi:hypothetical protein